MIQIKFKNLEKSELAREAAQDRIEALADKFPDLGQSSVQLTLEMENSPAQAGPDVFKAKLHVSRGRYHGVTVEKSNSNLFLALAELTDHMLETLNRFGDRARIKERKKARQINREIEQKFNTRERKIG